MFTTYIFYIFRKTSLTVSGSDKNKSDNNSWIKNQVVIIDREFPNYNIFKIIILKSVINESTDNDIQLEKNPEYLVLTKNLTS